MSMFNLVFPDRSRNERMGMLLALVGEPRESLLDLRLREGWVEKAFGPDGWTPVPVIAIYTRNGGGNRECYCEPPSPRFGDGDCTGCRGEAATGHPSYLFDADDEFDSTYRTYRFKIGNPDVTPEIIATLLEVAEDQPVDMSERWQDAIAAMSEAMR